MLILTAASFLLLVLPIVVQLSLICEEVRLHTAMQRIRLSGVLYTHSAAAQGKVMLQSLFGTSVILQCHTFEHASPIVDSTRLNLHSVCHPC